MCVQLVPGLQYSEATVIKSYSISSRLPEFIKCLITRRLDSLFKLMSFKMIIYDGAPYFKKQTFMMFNMRQAPSQLLETQNSLELSFRNYLQKLQHILFGILGGEKPVFFPGRIYFWKETKVIQDQISLCSNDQQDNTTHWLKVITK